MIIFMYFFLLIINTEKLQSHKICQLKYLNMYNIKNIWYTLIY